MFHVPGFIDARAGRGAGVRNKRRSEKKEREGRLCSPGWKV